MFKKVTGVVVLTGSLMLSQSLFASDSMCHQGLHSMVKSLHLNKEQKEKIQPILEQMKTTMKENSMQMDALKSQIREQMSASATDESAVNSLIDKKATLSGSSMKARMSAEKQISAVLTPEQKMKLQAMMKKDEEKMVKKFKNCHDE